MSNAHTLEVDMAHTRPAARTRHRFPGAGRVALYVVLAFLALLFLMPVYVMVVNSLKPLDEIRSGNLMVLPVDWTIQPWLTAWSTAQIGVQPTGLRPYFINSFLLVVPAVFLSTLIGALNG
jgi:glucose/mannose transport system permease protein